ncbi:hypothetical protein PC120_g24033 [Phytophthora cactorum]|nr:hypothetical protein PC120_g24033 [Phytophthora cactorum]
MWMDRNLVHMLSSGGSRKLVPINRRIRGEMQTLQAPELVRYYHRYMGGVDVHDQLRMQRYSVQLSYKTRKYYKTLFLGLVDMALVNAFIVFRHNKKVNGELPPKHYAFFETLMEQLMAVDAETFETIERATCAEDHTAASPARSTTSRQDGQCTNAQIDEGHTLAENPDTADIVQGEKKRQRTCKVCTLLKSKPRKYIKYYCPECSSGVIRSRGQGTHLLPDMASGLKQRQRHPSPTGTRAHGAGAWTCTAPGQEAAPPCAGRCKRRAYGCQWWIRERSLSPLRRRQERGRGCAHDDGLMDLFF